jgi:hypothetical protein
MRKTLIFMIALCTFGCSSEDDLSASTTTFGDSSSSASGGSSDTSTTDAAIEAGPERTPSCHGPEDVPPSLPDVDLAPVELEPLESGICPTKWCVENVSCGTCCDGDPEDFPPQGTIGCCTTFGNQRWPSATGTCGGSGLVMQCVYDTPPVPGDPPRRTPMPTSCENAQWTCPKGTHPESPNFECNYCPTEALGDFCFGASCSLCGGTTQQEY